MTSESPLRLAMWSGPRTISTAMMRAWGNRPDTVVWDEPFYAHYLHETGVDHPGAEEVIRAHEADWQKVIEALLAPMPAGKSIHYQKHMTHHLLPGIDRGWLREVTNVFLVRDPRAMLASLAKRTPDATLGDTGLPQQLALFEEVARDRGEPPLVLDADDVLADPRGMLGGCCARLGIAFTESMLSWPAGSRATDGTWARHWYDAVESSTGFHLPRTDEPSLPAHLEDLLATCMDYHAPLREHRLRAP